MTLDGQVLAIAFLALSLKLVVWSASQEMVETEEEVHRKDELNPDFGRPRHSKVGDRSDV